jgi:hypothetical protein
MGFLIFFFKHCQTFAIELRRDWPMAGSLSEELRDKLFGRSSANPNDFRRAESKRENPCWTFAKILAVYRGPKRAAIPVTPIAR